MKSSGCATEACPTSSLAPSPKPSRSGTNWGRIAAEPHSQSFSATAIGGTQVNMNDSIDIFQPEARITPGGGGAFSTEAMLLADEARSYFDQAGREARSELEPFLRVGFACE